MPERVKILIGCERSQVITLAARAAGIEAYSCDIEDCTGGRPEWHIKGDVMDHLDDGWTGAVFHPDCTYLTLAGEWLYKTTQSKNIKPGVLTGAERWTARRDAVHFVRRLAASPIEYIAIENPAGYLSTVWRPPDQYVQPYHYGDDASKKTGFHLKGFRPLRPTGWIEPRWICCGESLDVELLGTRGCPNCRGDQEALPRWANQTDAGQNREPPGPRRAARRSQTYAGIAAAIVEQWFKPLAAAL